MIITIIVLTAYLGVAMYVMATMVNDDINSRAQYWRPSLLENPFV